MKEYDKEVLQHTQQLKLIIKIHLMFGQVFELEKSIPFNLKIKREKKSILFSASHNGYKNLKNSPIHNENLI